MVIKADHPDTSKFDKDQRKKQMMAQHALIKATGLYVKLGFSDEWISEVAKSMAVFNRRCDAL